MVVVITNHVFGGMRFDCDAVLAAIDAADGTVRPNAYCVILRDARTEPVRNPLEVGRNLGCLEYGRDFSSLEQIDSFDPGSADGEGLRRSMRAGRRSSLPEESDGPTNSVQPNRQ